MPNPNLRNVNLRWANLGMAGDELLELWRKTAGVWALDSTIAVSSADTQTHSFPLAPGATMAFQIRARRGGTYRSSYASGNPEDWPSGSRLDYTAGLPKPVLAFTGWARTSSTDQHLSFAFTNIVAARATRLRLSTDGGSSFSTVATVGAGTSTYDYPIGAEAGTDVIFYIDQLDDTSAATNPGDHLTVYAGLEAPTSFVQIAPIGPLPNYGYTAQWVVAHTGAQTRVSDHWIGSYQNRALTVANATSRNVTPLEQSSVSHGSSHSVQVFVRIQHELTSFTVTDVSKWNEILFDATIYDDETAYNGP